MIPLKLGVQRLDIVLGEKCSKKGSTRGIESLIIGS